VTAAVTAPPVEHTLARYRDLTRRHALDVVERHAPSPHTRTPAVAALDDGGKGLRPALCLATCEAFGGSLEQALPSAAAVELLHTAFLVHDDVEDDSPLRRGSPAVHRRVGPARAINAGDALAVLGTTALQDNERLLGPRLASRVWAEFAFMARQTVDGQARELDWVHDGHLDLTPEDYLDLVMQKTCWYTTVLPLRVGALVGAGEAAPLVALLRFGFFLGAAFQIRDDLLSLVGSPQRHGKEPLGDLREGKRTLMLVHLLAVAAPAIRGRVEQLLRLPSRQRGDGACQELLGLLQQHGSVAFAEEFALGIARSAAIAFDDAFAPAPPSAARDFLRLLVPYMVERDH
jgi:geranylgeranyl diphosphate synthase type II